MTCIDLGEKALAPAKKDEDIRPFSPPTPLLNLQLASGWYHLGDVRISDIYSLFWDATAD